MTTRKEIARQRAELEAGIAERLYECAPSQTQCRIWIERLEHARNTGDDSDLSTAGFNQLIALLEHSITAFDATGDI